MPDEIERHSPASWLTSITTWLAITVPILSQVLSSNSALAPFGLLLVLGDAASRARGDHATQKRLASVEGRLAVVERKVREHIVAAAESRGLAADSVIKDATNRDVRLGLEAILEGIVADDEDLFSAWAIFAGRALAGEARDQVAIAALNALRLVTRDGLSLLRALATSPSRGGRVSVDLGDIDVAEALAAIGLMQAEHTLVQYNGQRDFRLSSVGRRLVDLTSGRRL